MWALASVVALALVLEAASFSDVHVVGAEESLDLREEVREAFIFSFDAYMQNSFPKDELLPLSCKGEDTLGSYALTLIDSLDTLAVVGNWTEFAKATKWVSENIDFEENNETVSLFETNIRVLGGLLSAHLLSESFKKHVAEICRGAGEGVDDDGVMGGGGIHPIDRDWIASQCRSGDLGPLEQYGGGLLNLALDLGKRLARAFEDPKSRNVTKTGIPYGSVNLATGVPKNETELASTAGAGTLAIEFGVLSRLTGDKKFEDLAISSVNALWKRRSKLTGLVGAHINITSGIWTHLDSGIGASVDSYYEYLLKGNVLLGIESFGPMFHQAYFSVEDNVRVGPWYVEVNMENGVLVWPVFNALQAFWPGLQTLTAACGQDHKPFQAGILKSKAKLLKSLSYETMGRRLSESLVWNMTRTQALDLVHQGYGCENRSDTSDHDLAKAIETHGAMFAVWKRHGATPEGYSLSHVEPQRGQKAYALRPELIESTYYLYLATRDPAYLVVGREMLASIQSCCRTRPPHGCGYASLKDVDLGHKRDHMESFFLSETLKYLYLLFDAGARTLWSDHKVVRDLPRDDYVFSTEGHLFPFREDLSDFSGDFSGGRADAAEGYCRPLHPIWNAPRYKRHFLPLEEAGDEPRSREDAVSHHHGPSGSAKGWGGEDIQARSATFLKETLQKLESRIKAIFNLEESDEGAGGGNKTEL